ncbi:type II toxin-antitoxin system VapC family toxin [Dyadobacter bucti]|uniref:type II toxin-antitoxin system VapC family toxin n=1 Tax=Dyadobacter bucti TaxID=2572203 RepID=UPI003F72476B
MYLIDSNIIIYSYSRDHQDLRKLFDDEISFVSEITRVEVLGYHKLTTNEDLYFKDVFEFIPILIPTQSIFNRAIELRKAFNLKLGDSIIAATAMENQLTIYSRNLKDFDRVEGLLCKDPFTL